MKDRPGSQFKPHKFHQKRTQNRYQDRMIEQMNIENQAEVDPIFMT